MKARFSDEYREKLAERERQSRVERAANEAALRRSQAACWPDGVPWQAIETCPFAALDDTYGAQGAIWVTDGESIALASVRKRFGRPVKIINPGELVLTDHGIVREGMEVAEFDHPEWWFEWELTDEFGVMTYAGGEETGKEEIGFVPTHWMPSPPSGRSKT